MFENRFGPKEVSEMLGVPVSTIRRYSVDFGHLLSESARAAGKKRFYTDQDVLILRQIRKYSSRRHTPAEIERLVQVVEPQPETTTALALMPTLIQKFEEIHQAMSDQRQELAELRDDMRRLRDELEDARQPWYKRIIGRKK
jgi:DNA-binding transcriptional MerR regulator